MGILLPKLVVLSAPSGTGKSSIIQSARKIFPNLVLSVSYTTRPPRVGENNGVDYFFIGRDDFQERINKQEFIEYAEVFGNLYGTSKTFIKSAQADNRIVILDIDVQGAMQLKNYPDLQKTMIFIRPPSVEELGKRLRGRMTESEESLKRRLGQAEKEMGYADQYDHVIINNHLNQAVMEFIERILKEMIDFKVINLLNLNEIISSIIPEGEKPHPEMAVIMGRLIS
ncbi:MAG: guanylate kinase [Deltaproteobacteria bacterium]|nr:guanylate kinase [Deltaproteobacteria bacterium]